jgi:hypothetical protein
MVTAALKFSSSNDNTVSSYTSPDAGRIDVLNVLNWHEAHDEYEWPDFTHMGFDFSQTMRFRRALVNDALVALEKAGNIRITSEPGVLGTPQSGVVVEGKRAGADGKCAKPFRVMCRVLKIQQVTDAWPSVNANASARTAPTSMLPPRARTSSRQTSFLRRACGA